MELFTCGVCFISPVCWSRIGNLLDSENVKHGLNPRVKSYDVCSDYKQECNGNQIRFNDMVNIDIVYRCAVTERYINIAVE